jgi:hypothetical protein
MDPIQKWMQQSYGTKFETRSYRGVQFTIGSCSLEEIRYVIGSREETVAGLFHFWFYNKKVYCYNTKLKQLCFRKQAVIDN